jgi:hypothetical protein
MAKGQKDGLNCYAPAKDSSGQYACEDANGSDASGDGCDGL